MRRFESCRPSFSLPSSISSEVQSWTPSSHIATVVVLAAGQGKRMKSELPKVLHPVCGRPMLLHVLGRGRRGRSRADRGGVWGTGTPRSSLTCPPGCLVALQDQQLGTGHAVSGRRRADPRRGRSWSCPATLRSSRGACCAPWWISIERSGAAATVLTMDLPDPTGYGRVVRDESGDVVKIVEHRDATPAERAIARGQQRYVRPAGSSCPRHPAPRWAPTTTRARSI